MKNHMVPQMCIRDRYQAETCVVWSRFASFIEVGGRTGLGYRDTSQDLMSVVHTNPDVYKRQSYDCMRDRFLGNYRTETNPAAVERGECAASSELGGNHCGALHKRLTLAPGEETRLVFLLGVGPRAKGREAKAKYSDLAEVDRAFAALRSYWEQKLAAFQCKTPHQGLDTMINTWTLYQAEKMCIRDRFPSHHSWAFGSHGSCWPEIRSWRG